MACHSVPANRDERGNYYLMGLDGYIWADGFLWSDGYLWSDGLLWSDGFAEPVFVGDWVEQE